MTRLIKVVPAILTDDPKAMEVMVRQAESFTSYVQFDIMDGRFVPSTSIGCESLTTLATGLSWEVHLMVESPEDYLECFQQAGAQKVVFHHEAVNSPSEVISHARRLGLNVGLAVNPETPVSAILSIVTEVDSVLFLTVNPGFYGSQFIPEVLDKVMELRSVVANLEIGVDGGIKEDNIANVASFGVDVIYVGSAIFLQSNPAGSFHRLQTLIQSGS